MQSVHNDDAITIAMTPLFIQVGLAKLKLVGRALATVAISEVAVEHSGHIVSVMRERTLQACLAISLRRFAARVHTYPSANSKTVCRVSE